MSANTLTIEDSFRRTNGRESRTQSIATRFTQTEERALLKTAESRGQNLREWARDVLLRETKLPNGSASTDALMAEIVGLQLFLTNVLSPVACGEQLSSDQYQELMRQVKANKHRATREVIAQYGAEKKEHADD